VSPIPAFVWTVIGRLRRRGLNIGVDDCQALRSALAAGFGLRSDEALRDLCISLWAKTLDEATLISTAFVTDVPVWKVDPDTDDEDGPAGTSVPDRARVPEDGAEPSEHHPEPVRTQELGAGVTPPPVYGSDDPSLFIVPRFPLSAREIAQIWRRLNRPTRSGPPADVDAAATLDRLSRSGVATPPVIVPKRTNRVTLLLLVDRNGSMTPFHSYVEHVVTAVRTFGRLGSVTVRYFHDTPGPSADRYVLSNRPDRLTPGLDAVIAAIRPLPALGLYHDPPLARADRLGDTELAQYTSIVVISDAGAARGRYDGDRLVDTIALGRTLAHLPRSTTAWLNPVQPRDWSGTTAEQVARHLPMVPMTRDGMTHAVDILRGRPAVLERPI
jgi:uncharacterized protein with von Willebrand factor type A (vWA) domain